MPTTDQIRAKLDHPVIDSDGHLLEFVPAVQDHLREIAGPEMAEQLHGHFNLTARSQGMSLAEQQAVGAARSAWWAFPARNTLDRATAHLPGLLYQRLDEMGLDFTVVYPTFGLGAMLRPEEELRRATSRAFNLYYAEACEGYGDRLTPAAVIPMHDPEEAIAELEFCVRELGFKVAVFPGAVRRPLPGVPMSGTCYWFDDCGPNSPHDYDPLWQHCIDLGVAPSFHSSAMGMGGRNSPNSYLHNHVGNFAAAQEGICRAMILGGVPRRFPALRLSFLEGGMGWACSLYADLVGHYEKRNREHVQMYDPDEIDQAELRRLFERFGTKRFVDHIGEIEASTQLQGNRGDGVVDEFGPSGIGSVEDIRDIFEGQVFVGCEADDPMNATAFDTRIHPLGSRLNALFGSDIGHWDVPDMQGVLPEAWELVEHGVIGDSDFRDFVFGNPVRLFAEANPRFFEGTTVEAAVAAEGSASETQ
jgi:predicted TIM-barrel fold metal-dependent hydrolase